MCRPFFLPPFAAVQILEKDLMVTRAAKNGAPTFILVLQILLRRFGLLEFGLHIFGVFVISVIARDRKTLSLIIDFEGNSPICGIITTSAQCWAHRNSL